LKVDTDMGELEVPKSVQKKFLAYCKKQGKKPEDVDFKLDFMFDAIDEADGKLLPEEEAVFYATYMTQEIPAEGGYPVWGEITFRVGKDEYCVIACSWTSELDEKMPLQLFAFKVTKKRKMRKQ
jgi:hypothetical protein